MTSEKTGLHPRNRHRARYDFPELIRNLPELGAFVSKNKFGDDSIDFALPEAVKLLNRAILKTFYGISYWDIPDHYLCPPIPGRADYIHHVADLIQGRKKARVLDIGVGANCVYPLIGQHEYEWSFVGSDIDRLALENAKKIVEKNNLQSLIELRLQRTDAIFQGMVEKNEKFDLVICNPPFHSSLEEARAGTQRKWKNLGKSEKRTSLNFGGQRNELSTEGGEFNFVKKMIQESAQMPELSRWFTSLVSKEENLPGLYKELQRVKVKDVKTIRMIQGQKKSRILAWSFA